HLLLDRLRQFLKYAFSQRTACNATPQARRLPGHLTHTTCQRALYIAQASALRQPGAEAAQRAANHASASGCSGSTPRVDLSVDLIHGTASDHRAFTTSASDRRLPRGLGSGCRACNQPSGTPTHQGATTNSTTCQHLRQRLGNSGGNVSG